MEINEVINAIFHFCKKIIKGNLLHSYSLTITRKLHQEIITFKGCQKEENRCQEWVTRQYLQNVFYVKGLSKWGEAQGFK